MKVFVHILFLVSSQVALASDPPASFTYQGKIYKANGSDPVEGASVLFKIQIRSPDGLCLLYEETHQRDMTDSDGIFALPIGDGTNSNISGLSLNQALDNSSNKVGAAGCGYVPAAGDVRKLRFSWDDGNEVVSFPTDQVLRSVPYALMAGSLQGAGKDSFIQVSMQTTQVKIDTVFSSYNDLMNLINGTSSTYAKSSDLPLSGGILNLASGGVRVADTPSSPDHAVNKNYADSKIVGRGVDLTGLANGQILIWNSAQNKWLAAQPTSGTLTSIVAGAGLSGGTITSSGMISMPNTGTAGTYAKVTTDAQGRVTAGSALNSSDITSALNFSPLNKAGDTLMGALNANTQNILNTGYITIGSNKYLGLGAFDSTNETNLLNNTLTPGGSSYAGVTWFNTARKNINFWNGTQIVETASQNYCDGNVAGLKATVASLNSTTDLGKVLVWSGAALGWIPGAQTTGTVTSITAGTGLSGGTITSMGTISMPSVGMVGTYAKVTTDAQGRVTAGTALAASDIPAPQGDVGGSYAAMSVTKLQGIAIGTTAPTNAQVLTYNSSDLKWQPASLPAVPVSSVAGKTGVVTLSYADLSGTLSVPQGGTGQTSYNSGQLLIGNSNNGLTKANLTAGSGVSIVNGDGAITISATGSGGTVTQVSASSPLSISNGTSTPAISLQAGSSAGQSLHWNGMAWGSSFSNVSELRGVGSVQQFPTTCTAAQTLTYQSPSDTYACTNIAVISTQVLGLGAAASMNVGTGAGTVAAGDDSRLVNAVKTNDSAGGDVSGSWLSMVVAKIQGVAVATTSPVNGQVLKYNSTTSKWEPSVDATGTGTVTGVVAGTGLTGGTITTTGTLSVDTGTTANKIVQLDASARLPVVDGSQLINTPMSRMQVIDASGTFNVPSGVTRLYVQVWGGGGGGGAGSAGTIAGGGGGAGGYGAAFVTVTSGQTIAVTVGGGGAGGSGSAGGAGQTTSFGVLISASGGSGGAQVSQLPAAGGTSSANLNVDGGSGDTGTGLSVIAKGGSGGHAGGGGGAGGGGSSSASNNGSAGARPGGGGGGGGNTLILAAGGGAGASGRVVVWW